MKQTKRSIPAGPVADPAKNRSLDTQAGDPKDIDRSQPSNKGDLRLPHEHDESPKPGNDRNNSSTPLPRQVIDQAASDMARGLKDTERRGIPSNVPAPGPSAEDTLGGEVPAAGIDRHGTASRNEVMNDEKAESGKKKP